MTKDHQSLSDREKVSFASLASIQRTADETWIGKKVPENEMSEGTIAMRNTINSNLCKF